MRTHVESLGVGKGVIIDDETHQEVGFYNCPYLPILKQVTLEEKAAKIVAEFETKRSPDVIYSSTDGITWTTMTAPDVIYSSTDGITWTTMTAPDVILNDTMLRRGLYDYVVICDTTYIYVVKCSRLH